MGVAGVAYATIIAQVVSAILVIISLLRHKGCIKLRSPYFSLDVSILKKIIIIGIVQITEQANKSPQAIISL